MTNRRYAIIGAGASGLCCAKYLKQAGFENITIFEIGTQIGGMWCYQNDSGRSSAYSTLHINSPRSQTKFEDFDFEPGVPIYPSHRDMHRYLVRYAEHFDLVRHIRFRSEVTAVVRGPHGGWLVTALDGPAEEFDRVIVCSGHLSDPLEPADVVSQFTGRSMHAHHYREPAEFVGRRVCVIGAGNSAFDICADICTTAERTVLVARSPAVINPKLLFGVPFRDITIRFERWWIPERVRRRIVSALVRMIHGNMRDLGFKPAEKRLHNTSNPTLAFHIAYRRVEVKHGITKIEGTTVTFEDSTSEEFDDLITATGYEVKLPFIDDDLLPVRDNGLDLYRRIVAPDLPGLYFIGFINTSTGLPYTFERQVQWLLPFECGEAVFPSKSEMDSEIDLKKRWLAKTYHSSPRMSLEESHVKYFSELKQSLKEGRSRAGLTPGSHRAGSASRFRSPLLRGLAAFLLSGRARQRDRSRQRRAA